MNYSANINFDFRTPVYKIEGGVTVSGLPEQLTPDQMEFIGHCLNEAVRKIVVNELLKKGILKPGAMPGEFQS